MSGRAQTVPRRACEPDVRLNEPRREQPEQSEPERPDRAAPEVAGRPILFVDGHCVLCRRAAGWVARRDRRGRLALASLQGETARRMLPVALRGTAPDEPPDSVVWRTARGALLLRSTAVLAAVAALGGWYRAAALLRLVPAPLRDALYAAVARRRRRWFGVARECVLPASSGCIVLD